MNSRNPPTLPSCVSCVLSAWFFSCFRKNCFLATITSTSPPIPFIQHAERSTRHHKTPYTYKSTRAKSETEFTKRPQGGTPFPPSPASSHMHRTNPPLAWTINQSPSTSPTSSSPPHASHTSKSHSSQHHHLEPRFSARPHPPSHVKPDASVSRLSMPCPD